eukprot:GHVU01028492.1.p3 GENE.GHVU01028492.1~~GHVU01028492.1.p3  ORF type:complete len:167 (-),score=15.10 GHVU01028492.1:1737-2237(-)
MRGRNVLHPMGWDSFGLPAEQHAIATGNPPNATVDENISRFRRQLQSLGLSYDWRKELKTSDPQYYKWTQWLFVKLFEHGKIYREWASINWCPELRTALANEEVINGCSERGGHPVRRELRQQWIVNLTSEAEPLLRGLEALDWPTFVKVQQVGARRGRLEGGRVS